MKSQLRNYLWFSKTLFVLSLGALFLMTACGARELATSTSKPPASVSVNIVPSTATVPQYGSLSFIAMVKGAALTNVTWSVKEGRAGGSITSEGVYTAPSTLGTYHVVATSVTDESASASAAVKVIRKASQGFTAVGNMTTARAMHSAILLRNGKVLIAGGWGDNSQTLASAELYDPSTRTFSPTGSMITPRAGPSATLLADGRVLIAGGVQDFYSDTPVFTAEIYDPSTGAFTATGDLISLSPSPYFGGGVLLPDGRVFFTTADNAETYDPQSGTFTLTGPYADPSPILISTITLLGNGKILVTGWDGKPNQPDDTCRFEVNELFDPQTGTFGVTGRMAGQYFCQYVESSTLLKDGKVFFEGTDFQDFMPYADAEVYDPATGTFASVGSSNEPHFAAPTVRLTDGSVLIPGGMLEPVGVNGSSGSFYAELYVPANSTFQFAGEMTVGRWAEPATLLPDGTVLITGGYSVGKDPNSTVWPDPLSSAEVCKPGAQ